MLRKSNVKKALERYRSGERPFRYTPSRTWYLVGDDNKLYPLKYIYALAIGRSPGTFNTSDPIRELTKLGFTLHQQLGQDMYARQLGADSECEELKISWQQSCRLKSGLLRKNYRRWQIPKSIRDANQLSDGDERYLEVCFRKYNTVTHVTLTSGGEVILPAQVGKELRTQSLIVEPSAQIYFALLSSMPLEHLRDELNADVAEAMQLSDEELQKRLSKAPRKPRRVNATISVFARDSAVVVFVLRRAKGKCEGCGSSAPFLRSSDGTPYLEVHHKKFLADGGEDTIENAIALCPNCHRRRHYGKEDSVTDRRDIVNSGV